MFRPCVLAVAVAVATAAALPVERARADTVSATVAPRPIVGFRVEGHSKVTTTTIGYLAHVHVGDPITLDGIPQLEQALLSSELFKTATVKLEETPGGYTLVATVDDKLSWIVAPTVYLLPSSYAFGVGYAENDLLGLDQKLLLYGQIGNRSSLLFGTYLDPRVAGTPLVIRYDLYLLRRLNDEYANASPTSQAVARESTENFLDAGVLAGWTFAWWLTADVRLRTAYTRFTNAHADDAALTPLAEPEKDGWDTTAMFHVTLDHRGHLYGLTWGPYLQLTAETSIPGLDDYHYQDVLLRAYYSWKLFGEHELELRTNLNAGRHMPFHEELTTGGVTDLRGYEIDQFRGDIRTTLRAEYSLPIGRWRSFAFRALGFWDSGYVKFNDRDPSGGRNYLPGQADGASFLRNDVGLGLRLYVSSVVLPLLGLDFGYGIEGHSPEVYFEVGLTDF